MNEKTKKALDTCLAITLVLIITAYFTKKDPFLIASGICLLAGMAFPVVFRPLVPIWFGFSHFLGAIVSRVFFTVIFFLVATPMGLFRRILGKDAMNIKLWKKSDESVFRVRTGRLTSNHLKKPF